MIGILGIRKSETKGDSIRKKWKIAMGALALVGNTAGSPILPLNKKRDDMEKRDPIKTPVTSFCSDIALLSVSGKMALTNLIVSSAPPHLAT
eukprot:CAMPEP_0194157134 /NCGR_PEP_ID=MMETSP0152-20130528/70823_1 /TAXON_ID=1049557 /ORGANISM="Thalassiothrix antarctica, Strain L6-D1" /LENGTH=91 /DNA_ID=CAMNT_0038865305 /DNA_START=662 /DNA_END=937 /DNA_ORIENTATION=-